MPSVLLDSGLSVLKQDMKASICEQESPVCYVMLTPPIDKSVQLYRFSALLSHGRQSITMTTEDSVADHTRAEQSARQSWEDETLIW